MTIQELLRLIRESELTSRNTVVESIGGSASQEEALAEKEQVDIVHPEEGVRTITFARHYTCDFGHFLQDKADVMSCSCGSLMCSQCSSRCEADGLPVCPGCRRSFRGKTYCGRHFRASALRFFLLGME